MYRDMVGIPRRFAAWNAHHIFISHTNWARLKILMLINYREQLNT